ncbi:MAG: DUF58 domain-containing protein [Planctomycetes bacterium]|nr:DUF58 domain-containing protein [Planctomycetota bacterium]
MKAAAVRQILDRPGMRSMMSGMARHLGPTGSGIVVGHRTYQPGDDYRLLDWPLFARTGDLHVRKMEQEMDLHVELLLDASASMGIGTPLRAFDRARSVAAELVREAVARRFGVIATVFRSDLIERRSGLRGPEAMSGMRLALQNLEPEGSTDLPRCVRQSLLRDRRRRMLVILTDGCPDPEAVRLAAHDAVRSGCSMRVVWVEGTPLEEHPALRRGPVRLPDGTSVDLRSPEARFRLHLARVRRRVKALDALKTLPRPAFDLLVASSTAEMDGTQGVRDD